MTLLQALVLGVLQGLSEFLPISSSGHLIVVPWLLTWPQQSLSFDVALHVGTLAALLLAFAGDWWRLLAGGLRGALRRRPFAEPEGRLLGLLALASLPAALTGLVLDRWAETTLRSPALVGATMALMGGVLFLADRHAGAAAHAAPEVSARDALLIGAAQALALVPGVSRSGATISAGLFLGHRREEAARFSFLLATPVTFGAALVKVPHLLAGGDLDVILPGTLAAAVVGVLCIRVLLAYVRTRDYRPFVYYRLVFALLVLAVFAARARA